VSVAVKLHRCSNIWVKLGGHPCWRVQRELDKAGVDYQVVKHGYRNRGAVEQVSGQAKFPVIEFDDGSVYREESKQMAATIRSGRLMEKRGGASAPPGDDQREHEQPGAPA
jgi:glutaredoxin